MEKLREAVIKLATADQNKPLLASQIARIELQLHTSFPAGLHTPIHPPYAAMIYKAIKELNEEGGSTEESISQYIKAKYKDLPFAHKSFLSLHLRKLCGKGFLVFTSSGNCYAIRNIAVVPANKRTCIRKHVMSCGTPPPEEDCFENDEEFEGKKGRGRKKAGRPLVFDTEDEEELCNEVTTKLSLTREQRSIGDEGRGRAADSQQRLPTGRAEQKRMLNESGYVTGLNVLHHEHDIDGVGSTVERHKGESSKGMVKKRKKKYKMKWMDNALSDHQPDKFPEEKSKEQHMRINKGNPNSSRKDKQNAAALQPLVQASFFGQCKIDSHAEGRSCNWYCLDCMNGALCSFCRASHQDHNVIRIRRSMWETAVSASELQMYIDVSDIQTHTVPDKDLISLKRTTGSKHRKHFTSACLTCKRFIPESSKFCSLNCKIEHDLASNIPSATN